MIRYTILVLSIATGVSCGTIKQNGVVAQSQNKADSLFQYHLGEMREYVDEFKRRVKEDSVDAYGNNAILTSILFLAENSGLDYHPIYKSFSGAGYNKLQDALDDLDRWQKWYNQYKGKLRWNEKLEKVELIE
jgi:hypothetical protein